MQRKLLYITLGVLITGTNLVMVGAANDNALFENNIKKLRAQFPCVSQETITTFALTLRTNDLRSNEIEYLTQENARCKQEQEEKERPAREEAEKKRAEEKRRQDERVTLRQELDTDLITHADQARLHYRDRTNGESLLSDEQADFVSTEAQIATTNAYIKKYGGLVEANRPYPENPGANADVLNSAVAKLSHGRSRLQDLNNKFRALEKHRDAVEKIRKDMASQPTGLAASAAAAAAPAATPRQLDADDHQSLGDLLEAPARANADAIQAGRAPGAGAALNNVGAPVRRSARQYIDNVRSSNKKLTQSLPHLRPSRLEVFGGTTRGRITYGLIGAACVGIAWRLRRSRPRTASVLGFVGLLFGSSAYFSNPRYPSSH